MRENINVDIIKDSLKSKNMTQTDLANEVGFTRQYISKILIDEKANLKLVDKISDILSVKKEEILNV